MDDTLAEYRDNNLRKEEAEIALHTPGGKKRWKLNKPSQLLIMPSSQRCFGMCERHFAAILEGTISSWRTSERL